MGDLDSGEVRYRAFLSYSHKDAAAAGRLHRRLEAYRIPRRLIGRDSPRGPVPSRLWPIFRDREELPAAADLSETVREALARSGALIILCSPHAAGSLWVAEEIRVFRELHPDRPILAAILEGDPPDCFPDLLRAFGEGHEPLATDLRKHRDGERLGLLKLVAGITGLGLDDLVQRDATRRVRRVMAVTAGAVAAMLVMAALTWFAIDARHEAERQRAAAEGQIEFMLTDLRERLKGVGRLDIMAAVNQRALQYYGGQSELAELPDESLARRARILHAIGDDYLARHDLDAAYRVFREAHQTTAEQLARAPDDPARIFEHAKSDFRVGRVYELRANWPLTQRHYAAFAAASEKLVGIEPNNPDYLMRAASSAIDLGTIELNRTRNYSAAEASYTRAVRMLLRAERIRPGDRHIQLSLANAYGWLADSFFVRSMWRDSLAARMRQHSVVEGLHRAEPANAEARFRLAAAQRGIAHSYFRMRAAFEARRHLFEAYQTAVTLTSQDAANAEWLTLRRMLASDLLRMNLGFPRGVTAGQLQRDQVRVPDTRNSHAPSHGGAVAHH
jgi:tetratricopeptide (TPR) repeat protein